MTEKETIIENLKECFEMCDLDVNAIEEGRLDLTLDEVGGDANDVKTDLAMEIELTFDVDLSDSDWAMVEDGNTKISDLIEMLERVTAE